MTPEQIEAARTKAMSWSDANPFRAQLLKRLGGLHKSPSTDRESDKNEAKIAHARDVAEAMATPTAEF